MATSAFQRTVNTRSTEAVQFNMTSEYHNSTAKLALSTTQGLFGSRIMTTTLRPITTTFSPEVTPLSEASHFGEGISLTHHEYGPLIVIPMSAILVIVMLFAIVGNIMVILTIARHKSMRTRTNMFIVNLAVADILVAVFDMPFSIVTLIRGDWVFGDAMCEFNGYTMAVFMIASVHTLMYISIHKYVSITRPFSRFMTPGRVAAMIAVTWIWSNGYALGGAVGWNSSVFKRGATQCGPSYPVGLLKYTHSMVNTLFNLLVPWGVMTFCYVRIFSEIRGHMSRMRETTNMDARNSMAQQKRISTTLFVVLICFLLCWSPYMAYSMFAATVKKKERVPLLANPLAYWCGYINSACNPIIYAFRSPSFRQGYYSIICGKRLERDYSSRGSSSQRSPSLRKRSQPAMTEIMPCDPSPNNARPTAEVTLEKKRKRFVSMNSWASIIVPPSPIRKAANGSTPKRQLSHEKEPSAFPLLAAGPTHKDDGIKREDSSDVFAEPTSPTALSPISEMGSEDVGNGSVVDFDVAPTQSVDSRPCITHMDIVPR